MKRCAIVIEPGPNNFSAYVPDLPGCVTTGKSLEETERNMREAISLHLEGMREDGETVQEAKDIESNLLSSERIHDLDTGN